VTPTATYRLQLHAGFTFDDAAAVVPYLARLGVSHVYLSPSLEAAPGSTHGYDVVDPTRLSSERGGAEAFGRLAAAADEAGLGLVLDIVPNHLGLVPTANPWWWDVLAHGRDAAHAEHFDIDFDAHGDGRVVVPELGAPLDDELAGGSIRLAVEDGRPVVVYHEHRWPVGPGTLDGLALPDDPGAVVAAVADDPALLRSVLDAQHYRLVHWRRANHELNYRRFFDITTLGGVRVEDDEVFADVHRRVLELVDAGTVDGLRVDHPDGLWDPAGYARRLRAAAPDAWLVLEKILEHGEGLRDWPVDGTVGYGFASVLLGQFVDPASEAAISSLYDRLVGAAPQLSAVADTAAHEVLRDLFPAEVDRIVRLLAAASDELGRDHDADGLRRAVVETAAAFDVYRTYVVPADGEVAPADAATISAAVGRARDRAPELAGALATVEDLLLLRARCAPGDEFVHRFQQLTGPVMAKGVEDTTLYRYHRFVALNEVGSDPSRFGRDLAELHETNAERQRRWPTAMLTTSTHDTKRSEDVRTRLAVCSQWPDAWVRDVERFEELVRPHVDDAGPTPAHRYLAFQTLVGAWPISADRLVAYLTKAAREGKRATSWLDPDTAYEEALERFARGLLADPAVVAHLEEVVAAVADAGRVASLAQTLVKLTSPGVPDLYQGTELWDLSLVDPDNRRPVDLARRADLLAALDGPPRPEAVLARLDEGVPKLWVAHAALGLRRDDPAAFGPDGGYAPVLAAGERADDVIAYLRAGRVATIAPRRFTRGTDDPVGTWGDTTVELPEGRWHDVLTGDTHHGGRIPLDDLLARFPVALLHHRRSTS
jgi:(1->4)-alpha-D-glucan 1-alpha-D-glucosylmutase